MSEDSVYSFDIQLLMKLQDEAESMEKWERMGWIQECYQNEIEDAWFLINAEWIAPNVFSSPDWIKEQRERYRNHKYTPTLLSELASSAFNSGLQPPITRAAPIPNWDTGVSGIEGMLNLEASWCKAYPSDSDKSYSGYSLRDIENNIPDHRKRSINPTPAFSRFLISRR